MSKGVNKDHRAILKKPSGKQQRKQVAESITVADRGSQRIRSSTAHPSILVMTWFIT